MVGDAKKPRSPFVVPRPWSLRSLEAPDRLLTRRLEPQGPCLPAGPPELLLRLGREEAAVHIGNVPHNRWFMQPFFEALRDSGTSAVTGHRAGWIPVDLRRSHDRWYTSSVPSRRP